MMKSFFHCTATILLLLLSSTPAFSKANSNITSDIEAIHEKFGVRIHYEYKPKNFFPPHWLNAPNSGKATPIENEELERLLPLIQQFLSAHPVSVIQKDLLNIYLVDELNFQGKDYAGTHRFKSIYIACRSNGTRFDDSFILGRLHSEFSSVLFKYHKYNFPTKQWNKNNPDDFHYPSGNGFKFLGEPDLYTVNTQNFANGFLAKYSMSCLENDFNMMSEWLFTKRVDLDAIAGTHKRIRKKQALAQQFYTSISPQYTFH